MYNLKGEVEESCLKNATSLGNSGIPLFVQIGRRHTLNIERKSDQCYNKEFVNFVVHTTAT